MEVISEKEVAKWLKLSPITLRNWRNQGKGPPYVKMGRSVRYRVSDIEKFLDEVRIDPEAEDFAPDDEMCPLCGELITGDHDCEKEE